MDVIVLAVAALVVLLVAVIGLGPIRSRGGLSSDSPDFQRLMNSDEFQRPPDESNLL